MAVTDLDVKKQKEKEKELKNSEALTKAIKALTEQFVKTGNEVKKATGPTTIRGAIGAGVKEHIGGALASVKQLATPAGILDMASAKMGGGIMSSVLSSASSVLKKRAAAKEDKVKWSSSYLTGTDKGRASVEEHGIDKASAMAAETYDKKLVIEADINKQEERRSTLKASGIKGADLSKEDLSALGEKKRQLGDLIGEKTQEKQSNKKSKEPTPAEPINQLRDTLFKAAEPGIRANYPEESKDPEFIAGVKNGMEEELLALNKEQLEELKTLVKYSLKSEEDKFEENKSTIIEKEGTKVLNEPPDTKKKGGIMDVITDIAGGKKGMLSKLGGLGRLVGLAGPGLAAAGTAAAAAGAGLAVGGAGAAGYVAGGLLNDYVLNPIAGKITGNKDDTVGTALYTGVDKIKGFFGVKSDVDNLKDADQASSIELGKKKLAEGKPISKNLADILTGAGVSVPADMVNIPNKPAKVSAVEATETVTKTGEAVDTAKAATEASNNTGQNAPNISSTSVNTNNTTQIAIRPEVRTPEPTFNRILQRNFS